MISLQGKPFFLSDGDLEWVEDTLENMTFEEKVGQLFCPVCASTDEKDLAKLLERNVGGIVCRPGKAEKVQAANRFLQEHVSVPLLIGANLESGGTGCAEEGTAYGMPMQMGAAGDPEQGYRLGFVGCSEGAAVGVNWALAPSADIARSWMSPTAGAQTFGSDPKKVLTFAGEFLRGVKKTGLTAAIRLFPGDGCDWRDHRRTLAVNDLSVKEWNATYGMIYRGLIGSGARSVLAGSIAMPAWAKKLAPSASEREAFLPASISGTLLQGLLRTELGFNGLITADASGTGFACSMERRLAIPAAVAAGVDLLICGPSFEEDYAYMLEGCTNGTISLERLDDCMRRILGLKACIGLHRRQQEGSLVPGEEGLKAIHSQAFAFWAKECARDSVTLVKDTQGMLPLLPSRCPRILLAAEGGKESGLFERLKKALEAAGFQVGELPPKTSAGDIREKYDAAVYAFEGDAAFCPVPGDACIQGPWFAGEIPTLGISFGNPFRLAGAPQIRTYVNAYAGTEFTVPAVVERITGRADFTGISPADPFAGRADTRL